jgi:hypothetical protein
MLPYEPCFRYEEQPCSNSPSDKLLPGAVVAAASASTAVTGQSFCYVTYDSFVAGEAISGHSASCDQFSKTELRAASDMNMQQELLQLYKKVSWFDSRSSAPALNLSGHKAGHQDMACQKW